MRVNQYLCGQEFLCAPASLIVGETLTSLRKEKIYETNRTGLTQQLKNLFGPILQNNGWKQNFPIDSSVSSNDYASFFIDFYLDTSSESCGHGHRFLLQFMFDNRQAIGTNLLKFDIASRNAALHERQTTSIALCVEKSRVRQLGWDGSAASAQEYIDAVLGPYNKVLTNIPVIFAIDNLTQEE